jgi:AAA family ATP:ADP antiporter
LFLVCGQGFGTSLYFLQAEIVGTAIPAKDERTQFFGMIDFGTQICTLVIQLSISATVLKRLGVSVALAILPAANFMSFSLLSVAPSLITMFIAMVMTRSVAYGMTVPAREVLFTVVSREDKYKSKSFIDTVVLRGGDALSGQFLGLLRHLHVTQTIVCLAALPLVLLWGGVAWVLGKRQRQLADKRAGASTNGL